jgi:hypothetical protein
MKTKPIPTAKEKREKRGAYRPPKENDARRTIKEQKYGYEYTLVEITDRPDNLPVPCAMHHSGYALKSFRRLKLAGSII